MVFWVKTDSCLRLPPTEMRGGSGKGSVCASIGGSGEMSDEIFRGGSLWPRDRVGGAVTGVGGYEG